MTREFEFYHGVVLSRLVHASQPVSVELYPTSSNSSYVVNKKVGLFVKYSKKRLTPWNFSFKKEHQDEILEMKNKLYEVFLVLVCHDDGIVTLSFEETKHVLDEIHEDVEWIRVARKPRAKYTITGSDGKLKYKIGDNEFPKKVLDVKPLKKRKVFQWFD